MSALCGTYFNDTSFYFQLMQNQETIKSPITLVPQSVFHAYSILQTSVGGGSWDFGHQLTILLESLEISGMYKKKKNSIFMVLLSQHDRKVLLSKTDCQFIEIWFFSYSSFLEKNLSPKCSANPIMVSPI